MRDQCRTHCTNSITNPVIENNKQITDQQDQKRLRSASTQNKLHRMKIRSRRLSFGPEPKSQEPHPKDASKIHILGGFLI